MTKLSERQYNAGHYDGMDIFGDEPLIVNLPKSLKTAQGGSYRAGDISVKEVQSDTPIVDPNTEFANKIRKIVSAAVQDKPIKGKLTGHKDIVKKLSLLLNLEKNFLKNMIAGKQIEDPEMVKYKALIEKESAELQRMSGLIWPFE